MKPIEQSIVTKAPAKKVWKAWSDMYQMKAALGKNVLKEGHKGHIVEKGRKVPFKIVDIKKGEGFTTVWRSFLVKMKFRYEVKQQAKGSLITCRVNFGGLLGWCSRLFLKKKMQKNLSNSLEQFVTQLDMTQKRTQIRSF